MYKLLKLDTQSDSPCIHYNPHIYKMNFHLIARKFVWFHLEQPQGSIERTY